MSQNGSLFMSQWISKHPGCDLDAERFFYSIRPGLRDVPRYFGKGLTPNRFFGDWESDKSQLYFIFLFFPHPIPLGAGGLLFLRIRFEIVW
ncbi:hypothetical protein CDAR_289441 [Caerostris darwini]|uniref:Uncharacterized protein n=1 Tax=Caerostris darwini TaxID=1538125 RepID=A0AAV4WBY5_9ARAC|nr:hypothetical protein CDAR_289441 [Caerostris darwini]